MTTQVLRCASLLRLLAATVLAVCTASALAFPAGVGLLAIGSGAAIKNNGSGQPAQSATPYWYEAYNQAADATLSGQTSGQWNVSGLYPGSRDTTISAASRATFGSLGVYASAWTADLPQSVYDDYYIYNVQSWASATAAFYDLWRVDVAGFANSVGTLTLTIAIEGDRTSDEWSSNTDLRLALDNLGVGSAPTLGKLFAGTYEITVPFIFGVDNGIQLSLVADAFSNRMGDHWGVYSHGGTFTSDFLDTATIEAITLRDASGNVLDDYALLTASGYDYLGSDTPSGDVPEPASLALLAPALAGLGAMRRRTAPRGS